MDYAVDRWINNLMHGHPLLAQVVVQFSTWGVGLFGAMAVGLWLLSPPGDTRWKRACAGGLSAAAVGLLLNAAISNVWHRPRPYEAHHTIHPLVPPSLDPSFPSDHATAALSIAFGVFLASRRAGWLFLPFGIAVAMSRILAGMHYPTDVLGSAVVSAVAALVVTRVAMDPVLMPLIRLVSRLTDPILARASDLTPARRTLLDPRFRGGVVLAIGVVIALRIAYGERSHLLDELPMSVLLAWAAVAAVGVRVATTQFWPSSHRHSRGWADVTPQR